MPSESARFWAKVRRAGPGECWLWTAAAGTDGYGRLRVKRDGQWSHARAHRLSWELHRGAIPADLGVLHRCDNPRCVNPEHLFLGTDAENVSDKVAKNRQARGGGDGPQLPHGEGHMLHKLTVPAVVEIRRQLEAGELPRGAIAVQFGVCKTTVNQIAQGKTWKHVSRSA